MENRIMFISNGTYKNIKKSGEFYNIRIAKEMDNAINREFETFDGMRLIRVPTGRFCNDFDFSATDGFAKATGSKNLNFVIADKTAITAITKYQNPKIIEPRYNQDADSWTYAYRCLHDLFVPTNKLSGVYIHAESSTN